MNVEIIKPYGFCYGVIKAIEITKKVRKDNPTSRIYMFGPLIHNEHINSLMKKLKINVLDLPYEEYFNIIDTLKIGDVVILPAHGHEKSLEKTLSDKGILFVDTTCKIISLLHQNIMKCNSKEIIYIGNKNHVEAITSSQLRDNICFYDLNDGFIFKTPKTTNPSLFYQTTLTKNDIKEALKKIKVDYPDLKISKSYCNECSLRQKHLISEINNKKIPIIIGSNTSSNTISLLKICQKSTKINEFYLISNFEDVNKIKFDKEKQYVIFSGTSTPNELVEKIFKYIRSL